MLDTETESKYIPLTQITSLFGSWFTLLNKGNGVKLGLLAQT